MIRVSLEPVDTLFFRDGTPFSADSSPQDRVTSLFPPHPGSLTGAIRAALALCNGWSGRGPWSQEHNKVLGDGPDDLGALSFDGPFLLHHGQPLFRAPRYLLGSTDDDGWTPRKLLRPGAAVLCDLGAAVRLPEALEGEGEVRDLKPPEGAWLTRAGLNAVLHGTIPQPGEVIPSTKLWSRETRIGLERDRDKRTAKEGMLYSTQHVRLAQGVSLGAQVDGVPDGWTTPFDCVAPLGGERRLAEFRRSHAEVTLDMPLAEIQSRGRVTIIALTPLDLEEGVCLGKQPLDVAGDVRVVSACLDRLQRIGGWDSRARRPLPLRSVLPPGSVVFCETREPARFVNAVRSNDGLARVGSRQRHGFGLVALGIWPDPREVTS